ncbi:unnamed protein product [Dibothriocephalus latus]|uniref:Uncharacterized protein n=1 Tax=Dibothriocephalus latus TaxID=60516 RepID=A0A3P7MPN2_DIBLA|nr:unnamed protein product [Dibothriocephalus latus]
MLRLDLILLEPEVVVSERVDIMGAACLVGATDAVRPCFARTGSLLLPRGGLVGPFCVEGGSGRWRLSERSRCGLAKGRNLCKPTATYSSGPLKMSSIVKTFSKQSTKIRKIDIRAPRHSEAQKKFD